MDTLLCLKAAKGSKLFSFREDPFQKESKEFESLPLKGCPFSFTLQEHLHVTYNQSTLVIAKSKRLSEIISVSERHRKQSSYSGPEKTKQKTTTKKKKKKKKKKL